MASASQLLTLISQLESMESSFMSIFLEALSKMANLTQSQLFVIFETPQGRRRIAGHEPLKQAFKAKLLVPQSDDVELDTNFEENVTMDAPTFPEMNGDHPDLLNTNTSPFSMSYDQPVSRSLSALKRKKTSWNPGDSVGVPKKSPRVATCSHNNSFAIDAFNDSSLVEEETVDETTRLKEEVTCWSDDDIIVEQETPFKSSGREDHALTQGGNNAVVIDLNFVADPDPNEAPVTHYSDVANGWELSHFIMINQKAKAIQDMGSDFCAEKGALSFKIMKSMIWDLSKEVSSFWPYLRPNRSIVLTTLFEELWLSFPHFEEKEIRDSRIDIGKQRYKFKGYMKHILYNMIKNRIGKLRKQKKSLNAITFS